MTAKKPGEKRLHTRCECRVPVVFENEFGDEVFFVHSRDISEGGIFLETDIPAKLGSMMLLAVQLPGQKQPTRVTGQVMRNTLQGAPSLGVGIRYVGLSSHATKQLQGFLQI